MTYEDEKNSYLNSILIDITDNNKLMEKISDLTSFLVDSDRSVRFASIIILDFLNNNFKIPTFQKTITEMAVAKLTDSATLEISCKIIKNNFNLIEFNYLTEIVESLFSCDLRSNLLASRIEAYTLLDLLLSNNNLKLKSQKDSIEYFRKFCGYEQDPRCLKIVFNMFPKFSKIVLPNLDDNLRSELFDTLSVFYPITQRPELNDLLCDSLSYLEDFNEELSLLVSRKLTNALADTRSSVFISLPKLLKFKTNEKIAIDVVVSFIKSMRDFFAGGSTDCTQDVVDIAINSILEFVKINEKIQKSLSQSAISTWIPEIINSTDIFTVRAYSIIAWSLDKILNFSSSALLPLGAVALDSLKINNETKVQSILASISEYLKIQPIKMIENSNLNDFFNVSIKVLSNNDFSKNCKIASLVVIRELSNKFIIPLNKNLISLLLNHSKINDFSSQCLISLTKQSHYHDLLENEIKNQLIQQLKTNNICPPFENEKDLITFITKLSVIQYYAPSFLAAFAETHKFRALLNCILPLEYIPDETSTILLESISKYFSKDLTDVVFAIGLRTSNDILSKSIELYPNLSSMLIFVTHPKFIPNNCIINSPLSEFAYGAKFETFKDGFHPPLTSLAFRNNFTDSFSPKFIPELLELENTLDNALGDLFDKFDILQSRFIYDPDYKMTLWGKYYNNLDNDLFLLCKLCLLCPPDFYLSSIHKFIPLLPNFLEIDPKGGLDLIIFTLLNLNGRSTIIFITKMSEIIPKILNLLKFKDPRIRLDSCKALRSMPSILPSAACDAHRNNITRSLKLVLDDPKREIRIEAGEARLTWLRVKE